MSWAATAHEMEVVRDHAEPLWSSGRSTTRREPQPTDRFHGIVAAQKDPQ